MINQKILKKDLVVGLIFILMIKLNMKVYVSLLLSKEDHDNPLELFEMRRYEEWATVSFLITLRIITLLDQSSMKNLL